MNGDNPERFLGLSASEARASPPGKTSRVHYEHASSLLGGHMSEDLVTPAAMAPASSGAVPSSESGIRSRFSRLGSSRSGVLEIDPLLRTLRKYHPKSDTKVV